MFEVLGNLVSHLCEIVREKRFVFEHELVLLKLGHIILSLYFFHSRLIEGLEFLCDVGKLFEDVHDVVCLLLERRLYGFGLYLTNACL